jgi:formylglycine-generating enzyme required for sulfatase activity
MRTLLRTTLTLAALAACSDVGPPRKQVLVVIDTDAPTIEQALGDPELSAAAAVDTVRVDILDNRDGVRVFRELSATSPLDWPVSFALIPPDVDDRPVVRLRVRAFRARDATTAIEGDVATLSPPVTLTIDRVVEVMMPISGVIDRRVVHLSTACFGRPTSFRDRKSCIDATQTSAPFTNDLPVSEKVRPTQVGSSELARAIPCAGTPSADRVCVPGGLSVLGSALTVGADDGLVTLSGLPMRLVRVSPYFMDRTEFTVGRARRWLDRLQKKPYARGASEIDSSQYCTFTDAPSSDDLPLNCVLEETAAELCAFEGGALPTEAEWNHEATGRGEGRTFPWGNEAGGCCNTSADRLVRGLGNGVHTCPGEGVEPVGSHPAGICNGPGDVSRDGVLDMGGSVNELLRDRPQRLDDDCWGEPFGVLDNPVCAKQTQITAVATRGGSWSSGVLNTMAIFRNASALGITRGFRCVYRDGTP